MAPTIDDVGQELVESYFVYRNEWATSLVHRCDSGHMSLFMSKLETNPGGRWTCTRYVDGVLCGKSMELYVPDDEGLTPLQWAKRALAREAKKREERGITDMQLGKAINDLVSLVEAGSDVRKNLALIKSRPAVKRLLEWLK